MIRPRVDHFRSSIEFLKSYFEFLRRMEPELTVRRWAVRMGLTSPKPLVAILRGERKIKVKDLEFILKGVDISPTENRYLEALIMWEKESGQAEKRILEIALGSIRQCLGETSIASSQETIFESEDDSLFSHWLDAALISGLRLKAARGNANVIRDNLLWTQDQQQVERSLERIRRFGLLSQNNECGLKPKYDSVTTKSDRYHKGARAYFAQMNEIAIQAVELPFDEREFQCFSIPVRQCDIYTFKQLLRKFRNEISGFSAIDGNTVYQFNLEMFPLLKPIEPGQIDTTAPQQ